MRPSDNHSAPATPRDDGKPSRTLSRRKFLALAGGFGALGPLGSMLSPRAWDSLVGGGTAHASGTGRRITSSTGRTLVILTLYGGNDGLNTVIPYQDRNYATYRGSLAVTDSAVLPVGDGYGLHPSLTGFKKLWDAGQLAIVQGVGFANPNYSHFESMDIWQSGVPDTPVGSGWLGRWLDSTKANPLRAISIGPTVPNALIGEKVQATAVPVGMFQLPSGPTGQALYTSMAHAATGGSHLLHEAANSNRNLVAVQRAIGSIVDRTASSNPLHESADMLSGSESALAIANGGGGLTTGNVLATQLSIVANLILSGVTTDVYSVELGGFDTHAGQTDTQSNLLSEMDTAVSAFLDALAEDNRGKETVVMIYSEFGRRVWANASGGTDHGWANSLFVAGHPVRGGFFGDPPSLSKLSEGNLIYTTDFRSVYATLLDQVLGVDPRTLLRGSFSTVPFI